MLTSDLATAVLEKKAMESRSPFRHFLCISLSFAFLLAQGLGEKCERNPPTVEQTQVGFGIRPKFMVRVQNNCPMCPVINVHLKCGSFHQAWVSPRVLKVLSFNDCVVNGGLPLAPLQNFSFNYSSRMYSMPPSTWFYQCE